MRTPDGNEHRHLQKTRLRGDWDLRVLFIPVGRPTGMASRFSNGEHIVVILEAQWADLDAGVVATTDAS